MWVSTATGRGFAGLCQRLADCRREFEARVAGFGAEVVSAGLVDGVESGPPVGRIPRRQNVDLIFCDVTTRVLSALVLPVAQRAKAAHGARWEAVTVAARSGRNFVDTIRT